MEAYRRNIDQYIWLKKKKNEIIPNYPAWVSIILQVNRWLGLRCESPNSGSLDCESLGRHSIPLDKSMV